MIPELFFCGPFRPVQRKCDQRGHLWLLSRQSTQHLPPAGCQIQGNCLPLYPTHTNWVFFTSLFCLCLNLFVSLCRTLLSSKSTIWCWGKDFWGTEVSRSAGACVCLQVLILKNESIDVEKQLIPRRKNKKFMMFRHGMGMPNVVKTEMQWGLLIPVQWVHPLW